MTSLVEIEKKYSSKIKPEGFLEIYERYLKDYQDKEIKILEIGVDKGASLKMWREYFSKATICGLDIDKKDFRIDKVDIIVGDQEGGVVIPRELSGEIADEASEMTAYDEFVSEQVAEGRSLFGLYPSTTASRDEFEFWRKNRQD